MKSEKTRPALGMKKTDFMQASSFNFIENEKMCNVVQRGGVRHNYQAQTDECDNAKHSVQHNGTLTSLKTDDKIEKAATDLSRTYHSDKVYVTNEERLAADGSFAPKRYVTKCYFQPKQNPVSYSETVIVTLGSKKKHYFETVMYQTKLIPFRWSETMTTSTPFPGETFQTQHEALIKEPEFHYMSLEPQQMAASEKLEVTV